MAVGDRGFVPQLDIDRVDEVDRRLPARVVAAPEDRVADEIVGADAETVQNRGPEIGLVVVEGQLEFGQAQHEGEVSAIGNCRKRRSRSCSIRSQNARRSRPPSGFGLRG